MATIIELRAEREEVRLAIKDRMLGRTARVTTDQSGDRVDWAISTVDQMRAYMRDLDHQIEALERGHKATKGPLRFIFG